MTFTRKTRFSKLKLFFSIHVHCTRLSTVLHDIVCVTLASSKGALLQSPSMHTREKKIGGRELYYCMTLCVYLEDDCFIVAVELVLLLAVLVHE